MPGTVHTQRHEPQEEKKTDDGQRLLGLQRAFGGWHAPRAHGCPLIRGGAAGEGRGGDTFDDTEEWRVQLCRRVRALLADGVFTLWLLLSLATALLARGHALAAAAGLRFGVSKYGEDAGPATAAAPAPPQDAEAKECIELAEGHFAALAEADGGGGIEAEVSERKELIHARW